jgi:hypothetical protein
MNLPNGKMTTNLTTCAFHRVGDKRSIQQERFRWQEQRRDSIISDYYVFFTSVTTTCMEIKNSWDSSPCLIPIIKVWYQ